VADRLDVAERLAEGRPAVERTQSYVQACRELGYQQPDLTSRPFQIRDWYDSEEGLDLHALDRDCAELRAAGAAVAEVLRMQRAQVAELAAAWTGPGADSAVAFLQRHCDAANTVAAEVHAAAQRCESLRDNLWYLLDSKVATAVSIDDRTRAQRPSWLAASAAVTTGIGDRPAAEETVRQQIGPYVANDIRDDWLTAMRSTVAGIAASYDMVIDRMAAAPTAFFEVPGDFGPTGLPAQPSTAAVAGAVAPAAAVPDPPAEPSAAPTVPTTPAVPVPDLGTVLGDASSMPVGDPGGGLSGLGGLGGLSGLASRIVDAMSGLLGSAAGQLTGPSALDDFLSAEDPSDEDPFHPDDTGDDAGDMGVDKPDDEPGKADDTEEVDETPQADKSQHGDRPQPVDAPPADNGPQTPVAAPAPVAGPAPVPPPTGEPVPPADEASTPCEIAADQLPQAGQ
jgi:hypothetical protein